MEEQPEQWSWGRFFGGFISGRRYGKDMAILLRLLFLVLLFGLFGYGVRTVWLQFFPKKQSPAVSQTHQAGPSTVNSSGGSVLQVDDHTTQTEQVHITVHEAPFGKGIFGMFGSQGKYQGTEEKSKK